MYEVEYLDSGEWVVLASFADPLAAHLYAEDQEQDYSGQVQFRVVRS